MFQGKIPIWNVFYHLYTMRWLIVLTCCWSWQLQAQTYFKDHFGGSIGLVANFGLQSNSIGVTVNGYYTDHFYQFNAGSTVQLFENSMGNRRRFVQNRTAVGLLLLAGKSQRQMDFEMNGLNHQTSKNLGIGYNYIFYFDSKQSSQTSGGFVIHVKELAIYHENDLFGGSGKDRFRTGQFHASFQYQHVKFTAGVQLWTGESRTAPLYLDSCKRCPSGYRDLRNTPYGRTSHGNAYVGFRMTPGFGQHAGVRIGIDSEEVRHGIQNLLIHNLGQIIRRPTPHYPRLDSNGFPVFTKEMARPNRFYLQTDMNQGWSY